MPPKPTKAELKRYEGSLKAFHAHYAGIWGFERWQNCLYPALIADTRYVALLNDFADPCELEGEQIDFISIPCLQNKLNKFPPPSCIRPHPYYNLDAASLLPVHFLDVREGHSVLDLCAAPGGKSIALAQKHPKCLHSNEVDKTRSKTLTRNLSLYLPADFPVRVHNIDATSKVSSFSIHEYDRVLVDAPCSSERHTLQAHAKRAAAGLITPEMLNWKASHSSNLAKTQVALLKTALRNVKIGGKVVYATCSLSETENDGVIEKMLATTKNEQWQIEVVEVAEEVQITEKTKYGRIAMPDIGGWGPIYFCVLVKKAREADNAT